MQIAGMLKTRREVEIIIDTDNVLKLLNCKWEHTSMSLDPYASDASCREDTGLNAEELSRAGMNRLYSYHTVRIIAC